MYKFSCTMLAVSLVVWGCTSASRNRWMNVLFEIPETENAPAPAADAHATPEPSAAVRTGFPVHQPENRFASAHPPFVTRDCAQCHNLSDRMKARDDLLTTCKVCHADYFAERVEHFPVKEGQCFECHDPHRSERDHLLTLSVLDGCLQCHDPPEDLSQPAHGAAGVENCTACHDPHFGPAPMLKASSSIAVPPAPPESTPEENNDPEE
jgi:predicted CXXCH cytochrome family protein